jgi:hypothetical protein
MARCDSVTLPAELDPNRENHPLPRHKFQSLPTASEWAPGSDVAIGTTAGTILSDEDRGSLPPTVRSGREGRGGGSRRVLLSERR